MDREISQEEHNIIIHVIEELSISKGDSVLDVGCGTGILYPYLKNEGIKEYMGIDISEKLLEILKQ